MKKIYWAMIIITIVLWGPFLYLLNYQHQQAQKAKKILQVIKKIEGQTGNPSEKISELEMTLKRSRQSLHSIGATQEEINLVVKKSLKNQNKFSQELLSVTNNL